MLILASASPRRQQLMALITPQYRVCAPDVSEELPAGTLPERAVQELALRKAQAVFDQSGGGEVVIGADTVVVLDRKILGKPASRTQAREMLGQLSGRAHLVLTGVAVIGPDGVYEVFHCSTQVHFLPIDPVEIEEYLKTGEPMDKAGAYGIQGQAARYINRIEGDYFNVMGLPVSRLYQTLKKGGFLPQNPEKQKNIANL
jgi:MAF protein